MKIMHERMMTDEETDTEEPNTFISRKPPWRSEKLNILFRALDERYHSSHNGKEPRRNRKVGPPSDRSPPTGVPSWSLSGSTSAPSSSTASPIEPPNSGASHTTLSAASSSAASPMVPPNSGVLHTTHADRSAALSPSTSSISSVASPMVPPNSGVLPTMVVRANRSAVSSPSTPLSSSSMLSTSQTTPRINAASRDQRLQARQLIPRAGLNASERAVEDGLDSEYESDQELTDWIMSLSGIKF